MKKNCFQKSIHHEWRLLNKTFKIKIMRIIIVNQKSKMNLTYSKLNDKNLYKMISQIHPSFEYLWMIEYDIWIVWKIYFVILRSINFVSNHFVSEERSRSMIFKIKLEILRWIFLNLSGNVEILFDVMNLTQINLSQNFWSFFLFFCPFSLFLFSSYSPRRFPGYPLAYMIYGDTYIALWS